MDFIFYFPGFIVTHDIFEETIGKYATHFKISGCQKEAKKLNQTIKYMCRVGIFLYSLSIVRINQKI